jgi:hypothetical protein
VVFLLGEAAKDVYTRLLTHLHLGFLLLVLVSVHLQALLRVSFLRKLVVLILLVLAIIGRQQCFEPPEFCFLFKEYAIEVHDLIFQFPDVELDLIVALLGGVDLGHDFLFILHRVRLTWSIYFSSSWCFRIISAIRASSYSHSLPRSSRRRSSSMCSRTFCFFSSSILKMFCWLYLRLAPRGKALASGGVASALKILGRMMRSLDFLLGL